ncbi:phage protein NinX family protein [Morganella morganii]|uniref:phage protein NinX family protein n=1 Tax=Morganella morganii TaxID=582 RepID=UPI0032DB8086
MNKYRDKSDFEINKAVAILTGAVPFPLGSKKYRCSSVHGCESAVIVRSTRKTGAFDPCNNPTDAMPIIIENKICMAYDVFAEEHDGGNWVAQPAYGFSDERVRSDNYYRAAMEVFLMMKEAENEKV